MTRLGPSLAWGLTCLGIVALPSQSLAQTDAGVPEDAALTAQDGAVPQGTTQQEETVDEEETTEETSEAQDTRARAFERWVLAKQRLELAQKLVQEREEGLAAARASEQEALAKAEKAGAAVSDTNREIEALTAAIAEYEVLTTAGGFDPETDSGKAALATLADKQKMLATLQAQRTILIAHEEEAGVMLARAREEVTARNTKLQDAQREVEAARAAERDADRKLKAFDTRYASLSGELDAARVLRCKTALCWGDSGTEYAIEPVLDLPVGIVWSFGKGALASYINANKLNIEFNAGLRFWLWHDRFSVMVYFAEPIVGSEDKIRLEGSQFEHATSSVHRPYPSVGLGFFGDILQVGLAYDVLVNGDSESDRDPRYRPNQVLSRSLTITIGIATVLTARTALAAGNDEKEDD